MIQANELRIGNWVDFGYKFKGEFKRRPCPVISINERDILVTDKGLSLVLSDDAYPIPLTPEILEKAGFEKINHIHGYSFWSVIEDRKSRKPKINIYDHKTEFMGYPVNHCTSLHQLQNLWHSLTGQELTINL